MKVDYRWLARTARAGIGFGMMLAALSTPALARDGGSAPEIDPGSIASALALLTGGVLMLTERRRRR
jgi:hypothetical protein